MRFATRVKAKTAIRWLIVICLIQALWIWLNQKSDPVLSEIIQRYPLGENAMVYVVLSNVGGATVPFTYHYFVHRRIDDKDQALQALRSEANSFLVTRDYDAKTSVDGYRVSISVRKAVYKFHNPVGLRVGDTYTSVDILLDAQTDYSGVRK